MKILFDHPDPFFLSHGGFQIQIEQTKSALEQAGVEVEYLRWWDENQTGHLIHFFGRATGGYIDFAHQKGLKVVMAELHTGLGSRKPLARRLQKAIMGLSQALLPPAFSAKLAWDSYRKADAFAALTPWEASLMRNMFDADFRKVHVIPNGVEAVFFNPPVPFRSRSSDFLVCTATIAARKRVLELAEAAVLARVPVWIIGKPYSDKDPYYQSFLQVHRQHPGLVRYEGPINDRTKLAEIYQSSRGFILLSAMESQSLSALEAAAAGCPLLLSDLPWARSTFENHASYCPMEGKDTTARVLRDFYEKASSFSQTFKPLTWPEVAEKFRSLYASVLDSK